MSRLTVLENRLNELTKQNDDLIKRNELLSEMCTRKLAQKARHDLESSDRVLLRKKIERLVYAELSEAAISVLEWEKLPDTNLAFFNSKRVEKSIYMRPTCIFPEKINGDILWYSMPFTGVAGSLDPNGEFAIVKPYIPSGTGKNAPASGSFSEKVVGKDCIIITDFFQFNQTNGNDSFVLRELMQTYAMLIADCEVAKLTNRNWLKIPFLIDSAGVDPKQMPKLMLSIKNVIEGLGDNEEAIVTEYANMIKLLPTGAQYHGDKLDEAIKTYWDAAFAAIGIAHLGQEKKAQQNVDETSKNSDQFNIRVVSRLQNRNLGIEQAKKIAENNPVWAPWREVSLKVNLSAYNKNDPTNPQGSPQNESEVKK